MWGSYARRAADAITAPRTTDMTAKSRTFHFGRICIHLKLLLVCV